MKHRLLNIVIASVLSFSSTAGIFTSNEAQATSVMPLSDEQLVSMSDIVIHATIAKTKAIQYDDRTILTQITVKVHEILKGDVTQETFTFYTRGGALGDYTQTIPGEFEAREGDEIVVFLEKIRRFDGKPMVLGLKQGAFIIQGMPMTRSDHQPSQRIRRQIEMPGNSEFVKANDAAQLITLIRQHIHEARHD